MSIEQPTSALIKDLRSLSPFNDPAKAPPSLSEVIAIADQCITELERLTAEISALEDVAAMKMKMLEYIRIKADQTGWIHHFDDCIERAIADCDSPDAKPKEGG